MVERYKMNFFSRFFKSSQKTSYSSRKYDIEEQYSDNFNTGFEPDSFDDCDEDSDFEIVFWKELSNGVLIFFIIDDDYDPAGHIIVTNSEDIEILESGFYEFEDEDRNYLRRRVREFCKKIGK